MSNSAEFFNILSDTLYSDKPLAVVREVLCNAWDIHIQCGIQDKPVQVTITPEQMTIRDFGTGISPEMMPEIYCTYGNSTKKNDGKQTGGFGLGSKSPFAYTDHFDVVSCHKNLKTIYKLSKSSAEVEGKPGLLEIMSIPTTESGLEVTIRFNESHDYLNFKQIVERIASHGGMNVKLNDRIVRTLPFDQMKHNWLLIPGNQLGNPNFTFFVRYGNVIYPVANHVRFNEYMSVISDFLGKMPHSYWQLVLKAEPNTISVTPSRESLSLSERTLNTLEGLFSKFCRTFNTLLKKEVYQIVDESRENLFREMKFKALWDPEKRKIPGLKAYQDYSITRNECIFDYADIIRVYAKSTYPNFDGFEEKEFEDRLRAMMKGGMPGNNMLPAYYSDYMKHKRRSKHKPGVRYYDPPGGYKYDGVDWLHRRVLAPIYTELKAAKLPTNKLLAVDRKELSIWGAMQIFEASKIEQRGMRHNLLYARKIVVLVHKTSDAIDRLQYFPNFERLYGKPNRLLVYSVARSTKRVEEAKAVFTKLGYNIFDLTVRHPWELPEKTVTDPLENFVKPAPAPKKPAGIPVLRELLLTNMTTLVSSASDRWADAKRTETPKVVIRVRNNGDHITLDHIPSHLMKGIVDRYADIIGVCISLTQEDKYMAAGAVDFYDFFYDQMLDQFLTNPRIRAYYRLHERDFMWKAAANRNWYQHEDLFRLMSGDSVLSKALGFKDPLTESDIFWIEIYQYIADRKYQFDKTRIFKAIELIVDTLQTDSDPISKALKKMNDSQLLQLINTCQLEAVIQGSNYVLALKAKKLLITAMKG